MPIPSIQKLRTHIENDKQLIQPIGARLLTEEEKIPHHIPKGIGYHQARKAYQSADNKTMAERIEIAKSKES